MSDDPTLRVAARKDGTVSVSVTPYDAAIMTPEQARGLARALCQMADAAERIAAAPLN